MIMTQMKRYHGVQNLIDSWIESSDPIANGQIIRDASFSQLRLEIEELLKLGRTAQWYSSITLWINFVLEAERQFRETVMECDNHEMFTDGWEPTWIYEACSHNVKKDYARLFKWALYHGAIKYVFCSV